MPTEILMPALSPTMEEGTSLEVGQAGRRQRRPGDVIAEIETDKATMEVEAIDEGKIGKILIAAGTEGVKVNTPIAILLPTARARRRRGVRAKAAPAAEGRAPRRRSRNRPTATSRSRRRCPHRACRTPSPRMSTVSSPRKSGGTKMVTKTKCARRSARRWPRRCAATTRLPDG